MQNSELLISSDSHVIEPVDLWEKNLPQAFRDFAPKYPTHPFQAHEGGADPVARVKEMAMDGVSGEVLYPSLTMDQFGLTNSALQEACFRVYNDWLIDYCAHCPERLFGVGVISAFNIDNAINEVQRCKKKGMRGVMLWQTPPQTLSFSSTHYDRLWSLLQELDLPVSLHILTGAPYAHGGGLSPEERNSGPTHLNFTVNLKVHYAAHALTDLIGSGVLDRFPKLRFVLVENEVSWLPFFISQWDKYVERNKYDGRMKIRPSDYFQRQVFCTFFNDPPIRWLLGHWGNDNCMWSNDFPHKNSTWPNSREVISRDIGELSPSIRANLLHGNVQRLYHLPKIEPVAVPA